jgi:hypothetical protein
LNSPKTSPCYKVTAKERQMLKSWYLEIYFPASKQAEWHGYVPTLAEILARISAARRKDTKEIFRVIAPLDAPQAEIEELEALGALRT